MCTERLLLSDPLCVGLSNEQFIDVYSYMDLRARIALVRIGQLIKLPQMRIGVPYLIFAAETVTTRLGTTVTVHLRDLDVSDPTDQTTYDLYLPKRYAKAFRPSDIEDINCDRVWGPLSTRVPTLSQKCTFCI
jgi:hypothetical protein